MEFVSVCCHADAVHRLLKIQQDLAGTFLLPRDSMTGNITEFLFYYVKSHWNAQYKHLIHFNTTLHSKKRKQEGAAGQWGTLLFPAQCGIRLLCGAVSSFPCRLLWIGSGSQRHLRIFHNWLLLMAYSQSERRLSVWGTNLQYRGWINTKIKESNRSPRVGWMWEWELSCHSAQVQN